MGKERCVENGRYLRNDPYAENDRLTRICRNEHSSPYICLQKSFVVAFSFSACEPAPQYAVRYGNDD